MFGRKWEPAQATITGVEPDPGGHHQLVYLVDVPLDGRGGLRARLAPTRSMSPDLPPGTQVKVEVNAKTGEVRFDADPVEGFSPGQIESPGDADSPGGADWAVGADSPGRADSPGAGAPGGGNVTVNVAEGGSAAIGDVAEIVKRLGGGAAGSAVAAALANMLAAPVGPELTDGPKEPGTPGATEVHVTAGDPEVRVVSGAEAAEFMRQFFGGNAAAAEQPTAEQPTAEQPTVERPAAERPTVERPTDEG
ncbi:MAG: hypothetical protein ACRDPO_29740 [Streptosporangiaceae bacterium]